MEVVMQEISERLRQFREQNSMSQSELSRALNISRGGVNRWEKGDAHKMSLDIAIGVCDVLGVTLEELARGRAPVGALDVDALGKAMTLVSGVFKRMDDRDRANLVSMVYQLVAQGNDVPPSLVTQMASLIR
jgi:transcriptional regulator with XRE-family HTH domain